MKKRVRWIACLLAVCSLFLLGAAQAEDFGNLLYNPDYQSNEDGTVDAWMLSEGTRVSAETVDTDTVLSMTVDGVSSGQMSQAISVDAQTIYRIRFTARVKGTGTAYAQIEGLDGTRSAQVEGPEWQTVDLYGLTSPEQMSLVVVFGFDLQDAADATVEWKDMELYRVDEVPAGAQYEWFYDRTAYEEQQNIEQTQQTLQGVLPAFALAGLLALAVWLFLKKAPFAEPGAPSKQIWFLLGGAFVLNIILAALTYGHPTDMTNFSAWATHAAEVGIPDFYISGMWADYPPGYIYVLYLAGLLAKLFGASMGTPVFNVLIKLPAILADLGSAYIIYRLARKQWDERTSLFLGALMALNPLSWFDSAIWGQMDSVLALMTLGALWYFVQGKKHWCAVLFVAGVLVKPQMLIFGPILLVAYVKDIVEQPRQGWKDLGVSVLAGVGTLVLIALPFTIKQNPAWLIDKYTSAAGLYPYATVNAFNIYALFGGNWVSDSTEVFLGISIKTLGTLFIVAVCILGGYLYWRSKERKAIVPVSAIVVWGIICFAQNMHERYLFPAALLFLVAYILYRDRRFLICFGWASAVVLANTVIVFFSDAQALLGVSWPIAVVSLANLAGFGYSIYAFWAQDKDKRTGGQAEPEIKPEALAPKRIAEEEKAENRPFHLHAWKRDGEKMTRRDYLIMGIITALYAVVALVNLGSRHVPESYWRPLTIGEEAVVDLGATYEMGSLYYYPGVSNGGRMEVSLSADGQTYSAAQVVEMAPGEMYTWRTEELTGTARYVKIRALDAKILVNEVAFYDSAGNRITTLASCTPIREGQSGNAAALIDEQDRVKENPSYLDEMYFDEIYHARTAFEHLHGFAPYENTHPPLGKVFIMLGVALFGMNPFGWRIIGTLFGIAMLPLLYVFAKRLFRNTKTASIACGLFALDGMHFVQTRIATIDVYGVFFIIAMCYFMFRYWQMNFYTDGLKKTFVPLGLCGVMFGLGVASKWIGLYAGAGLAVAFFTTLFKRYREYEWVRKRLDVTQEEEEKKLCRHVVQSFWPYTIRTCAFCVAFFILIPIWIYLLSYLPYLLCAEKPYSLSDVWDVQTYMFNYHSQLTATHPFQSAWYTWPVIERPIYYYSNSNVPAGMMQSLAAFGNPAVWWSGLVATLFVAGCLALRKIKQRDDASLLTYLMICLGGALLPWVFITRATFIYHYFASVPFIILFTAWAARPREATGKLPRWVWILLAASAALFCLFYPVWGGVMVDKNWAMSWLRWFESWWFF